MPVPSDFAHLTTLAQALARAPDLDASLHAALATVAELLGLETGWVWLLDDDGVPALAASRALPAALLEHPDAMHGDCYCLQRFRDGDLTTAANVSVIRCSRLTRVVDETASDLATAGLRCHASVPLTIGDRRLGMLNVASRDWRTLSENELNLLTTAGALVSLAVERARLEATSARAVAAEERNRLAREIHDTIAQSLAALTMQLEVADALASNRGDSALGSAVSRALRLTRSTLDEARRSVLDLRADLLGGRPLPRALEDLAGEVRAMSGDALEIRVTCSGFEGEHRRAPSAVEIGLYRIAQQALANVARHAGATSTDVRLTRNGQRVQLRIEDDGIGFDPARVGADRFGLIGMRERARLLGGALSVESSSGTGSAIVIDVPLDIHMATHVEVRG